jgi:NADPH2 dehydrogenase
MKRLFESHNIGKLAVKNRICVPAMVNYHWAGDDGIVTKRHLEHYLALARGGHGLIIQEAACVSSQGRWVPSQLGLWNDEQAEKLKVIVDTVHNAGAAIFAQIHHSGVRGFYESVGPSVYSLDGFREKRISSELSESHIHKIQNQFTEAALRAKNAGYDGIELHGTHGYLISNFFNYNANRRADQYGDGRWLFAYETIKKVRSVVGERFVVGIRIGGYEPDLESGIEHAIKMQEAGADFLNVSFGEEANPQVSLPEDYPFKIPIYAAQMIKKMVSVPVFGVYKIGSSQQAKQIIEQTGIDMVCVGRGALVNPSWAKDAQAGLDVGRCLDCAVCQWRVDEVKRCPGRVLFNRHKMSDR